MYTVHTCILHTQIYTYIYTTIYSIYSIYIIYIYDIQYSNIIYIHNIVYIYIASIVPHIFPAPGLPPGRAARGAMRRPIRTVTLKDIGEALLGARWFLFFWVQSSPWILDDLGWFWLILECVRMFLDDFWTFFTGQIWPNNSLDAKFLPWIRRKRVFKDKVPIQFNVKVPYISWLSGILRPLETGWFKFMGWGGINDFSIEF